MASPTIPAQRERAALCDLLIDVGPDAPTLAGDWTTRDLAAHLVMREHRPDGAAGIAISRLSGYADKVQSSIATRDWDDLIETVRTGPPKWSPTRLSAIDALTNTIEFYVHHEDVRRAQAEWSARDLDDDTRAALAKGVSRMAKPLTRSSNIGIVLEPDDVDAKEPIVANKTTPLVTVRGPVGEVVLFVYGRQSHSQVELVGDLADIETVRSASFGF